MYTYRLFVLGAYRSMQQTIRKDDDVVMAAARETANIPKGNYCFALLLVLVLTELFRDRSILNGVSRYCQQSRGCTTVFDYPPKTLTNTTNGSHFPS